MLIKWSNFSSRTIGMKARLRRLSMLVKPKTKWTKSSEGQLQWMASINRSKQMILTMIMEMNMVSGAHRSNIRIKWSKALMNESAFSEWHLLKCTPCSNDSHLCRTEWWVRLRWRGRVWVLGVEIASSTAGHLYLLSRTRTWQMHKNQAMVMVRIHSLKLKGWCLVCLAACGLLWPQSLDGAATVKMMKSIISSEPAQTPFKDSEMTSRKIIKSLQMVLRHL